VLRGVLGPGVIGYGFVQSQKRAAKAAASTGLRSIIECQLEIARRSRCERADRRQPDEARTVNARQAVHGEFAFERREAGTVQDRAVAAA